MKNRCLVLDLSGSTFLGPILVGRIAGKRCGHYLSFLRIFLLLQTFCFLQNEKISISSQDIQNCLK